VTSDAWGRQDPVQPVSSANLAQGSRFGSSRGGMTDGRANPWSTQGQRTLSDCPISGFTQPHGNGTRDPWLLAQAG
jgi:hypothetical protein